ncbi:MAG TPA: hypothetical protein VJ741_22610 [Solirubrobacteraceae bacterium]|nr:hypothetical protein [Solirubrobacteraceae bacterium]
MQEFTAIPAEIVAADQRDPLPVDSPAYTLGHASEEDLVGARAEIYGVS